MTWGRGLVCAAGLALLSAAPAQAVITESVTVSNTLGYFFDTGTVDQSAGGTSGRLFLPSPEGDIPSELGIQYVGEAGNGSFYFLHNNYCVGLCSTGSRTTITFTVTNTGRQAEALRFDSLITPGHLARLGNDASARAGFTFSVTQSLNSNVTQLYSASGSVTGDAIGVVTSDNRDFNGLREIDAGDGTVLDWGATNLNLALGLLGAGQTTTISYVADYYSTAIGANVVGETCLDLSFCTGAQVVFGDPRTNGGGINQRALRVAAASAEDSVRDIINRDYGAYQTPYAIVDASTPLPGDPPAPPELTYGGTFTPIGSVPEAGSWAMMTLGLGAAGWSLRRRARAAVRAV